jgi:four helix bundle protein
MGLTPMDSKFKIQNLRLRDEVSFINLKEKRPMATFKRFEELDVWRRARTFADNVYAQTLQGSFAKDFSLRDQITRSSGSVMDNIAEGFERGGTKEFIVFLSYAKGSAGEARSQLCRAYDRKHLDEQSFNSLRDEALDISKSISGFMTYLRNSSIRGSRFHEKTNN